MPPASFKGIFAPTGKRSWEKASGLANFLKDSFSLPTLLVLAGFVQGVLSLILPSRYALLPTVFVLLRAVVCAIRDVTSLERFVAERGVIKGRTSAQLPNASYDPVLAEKASPFGSAPAEKSIVVLHLGARFNHPLGGLAPGSKEVTEKFMACHKEVLTRAKEFGCLGGTSYRGDETASNNTVMTVYYFRDLDGLNSFAHDRVHREAWDWYKKECLKKGYSHIGIFHEAFCAPAGAYETIYVNMQPTLLGAGSADVKNEATGTDDWVRTVVDASSSVWRSQHSRMGRGQARETDN
ncbi:uncharacterized protein B0H64DRAFT_478411 [Chaetomium fimeti]|uniref:Uncharacterized protein n=1 Tax=Chaetomium fimeti TaxID=1854472 RepID=A0AAE0H6Y8_9PEZI|nr:hypothetical protein B0H64DRAFT_478411 [Chaetomium fimeti]